MRFAALLDGLAPPEPVERLEVLETLSYGTLYEGRIFHASRSDRVSLLLLDPAFAEAASASPRAVRTLLASSRIRGAHLQTPRALCRQGESLYELYDAHPGMSLSTGLDFIARSGVQLSSEAILRIASSALHALDELERAPAGETEGIRCHGLLNPENFLVTENHRVLIRGVGLWQAGIAQTGLVGARQRRYIASGQSTDASGSPRHDLLALGAILFETTTGSPAFDSAPTDEDVAELTARIEETRAQANATRRDLLGLALACLNPVAVTPASRSRLRILVDTMFLREAAAERVPGILSLEDLAGRVKSARPAIVKAVALSLESVEVPVAPKRPPPTPRPDASPDGPVAGAPAHATATFVPAAAGSASSSRPEASRVPAAEALSPDRPQRAETFLGRLLARRPRPLTLVAIALVLAAVTVFVVDRARRTHPPDDDFDTSVPAAEPAAGSVPEAAPPPAAVVPSSSSETRPTAKPPASGVSGGARAARDTDRRKPHPAKRPAASAAAPAVEPGSAPNADAVPPPPVPSGSLVELGTPGLVLPVLLDRPEDPRFSPQDPRPPAPGSVLLEILVDEHGRAIDHRILSATRFPAGIAPGIARYIGALRFRPPEVRGVPVRVWIRHDMRFLAP